MKIALFGDLHGQLELLATAAEEARQAGASAAIQLGDLGFCRAQLGAGQPVARLPIPVYAICGNHEEHAFLQQAQKNGLSRRWAANGLIYQARGSCTRLGGKTIGFLGGALHVDRPQEQANRPSAAEIQHAIGEFSAHRPQLIATHSCPAGIGIGMRGSDGFARALHDHVRRAGIDPGPADDCGEPGLTELWHALPEKPALWVFGHFHSFHDSLVGTTRFISCPLLLPGAPFLLWDSQSKEISFHTPPHP